MSTKRRRRVPPVGAIFQHRYKGILYEMQVVEVDGAVQFQVGDDVFKSPTAAAKSIVGKDTFISGPAFWHLDRPPTNAS